MEQRYGNLKSLAQLKTAVNQSGITDSLPPENDSSRHFGKSASFLRSLSPKLTPEGTSSKNEKEESHLTGEIMETGIQHGVMEMFGFGSPLLSFALEFALKVNEAYHEMNHDKQMAMEAQENFSVGTPVVESHSVLKGRIRSIKSELEEEENNKNKKRNTNSIRFGRASTKYTPF